MCSAGFGLEDDEAGSRSLALGLSRVQQMLCHDPEVRHAAQQRRPNRAGEIDRDAVGGDDGERRLRLVVRLDPARASAIA